MYAFWGAFQVALVVKNPPANIEDLRDADTTPGLAQEDSLEEEMATHSSVLTWRIPMGREHIGLQSMGSQESDTTEAA